jgi:hypothetical protein
MDMTQVAATTLKTIQDLESDTKFADLVHSVVIAADVDEATAKAAILRVGSEGFIEITADWHVRLNPLSMQRAKAA